MANVGKRVDAGGDVHVGKLAVYSFVPLHSMGSERLHRDARGLDAALAERLARENTAVIVTDVDASMHRHALAMELRADREGTRRSSVLPVKELLEAQRPEEVATGATHRLVIVPVRLTLDRATGVAHGVLHWRLETTGDATPVALGLLRYTADVRGYPARRMASALVTKLRSLGIR